MDMASNDIMVRGPRGHSHTMYVGWQSTGDPTDQPNHLILGVKSRGPKCDTIAIHDIEFVIA